MLIYHSKLIYYHKQIACSYQFDPNQLQTDWRLSYCSFIAFLTQQAHFENGIGPRGVAGLVPVLEVTISKITMFHDNFVLIPPVFPGVTVG